MGHTIEDILQRAEHALLEAESESQLDKKDVMTHLVCTNSRKSILDFMIVYLLQKNIPIEHPVSLESLHTQCKAVDRKFDWLDLRKMNCRFETDSTRYCLGHHTVDSCLSIAQKVRYIVMLEKQAY